MKAILRMLGLEKSRRFDGPPGYWRPDANVAERIRAAYLRTLESYQAETSQIWMGIFSEKHKDIHDALMSGGERLQSLLSDPVSANLYYGVDMMSAEVSKTTALPPPDLLQDSFRLQVAELVGAVGADRMPNPVGGTKLKGATSSSRHMEELLTLLDVEFQARVDFPNPFRGELFVTETARGFISYRALHALYQARRLYCAEPRGKAKCLEIGGGTGRTAYYAAKWGLSTYTIVDLPMTAVGQACFLLATLGQDKVSLYGEEDNGALVRLRPPHWLFACGEEFDVALNCDSLTEMSRDYAERYIAFIKENCRAFISINHEANDFTVRELWPGLMRFPYTMRPGYVEEFTPPGSASA